MLNSKHSGADKLGDDVPGGDDRMSPNHPLALPQISKYRRVIFPNDFLPQCLPFSRTDNDVALSFFFSLGECQPKEKPQFAPPANTPSISVFLTYELQFLPVMQWDQACLHCRACNLVPSIVGRHDYRTMDAESYSPRSKGSDRSDHRLYIEH